MYATENWLVSLSFKYEIVLPVTSFYQVLLEYLHTMRRRVLRRDFAAADQGTNVHGSRGHLS